MVHRNNGGESSTSLLLLNGSWNMAFTGYCKLMNGAVFKNVFFLDEYAICNMMLNIKGLAPEMHQIRENICHIGWEKLFFCVITCCVTIACFPSYNFNCYLTIRIWIRYINVNIIEEW